MPRTTPPADTTPAKDSSTPKSPDRRALTSAANGRKSGGPATPEGKARSRFNALKHGIHATSALIADGPRPEDREQLIRLYRQFHADLAPVGLIEELLVERVFVAYWRLRRVLAAESALFLETPEGEGDLNELAARVLARMDADPSAPDPLPEPPPGRPARGRAPFPQPGGVARITRYEAPLERAFYRALRELHAHQAARLARAANDPAPPHP